MYKKYLLAGVLVFLCLMSGYQDFPISQEVKANDNEIVKEQPHFLLGASDVAREVVNKQRLTIYSVEATGYTWTGKTMANLSYPTTDYVACNFLPLGTEIYIYELDEFRTVGDRIGYGSDLDLYFNTKWEALQFGRQNLTIGVLQ